MIIEYFISDESVIETREMLNAEKRSHEIHSDLICFAKVVVKNDVYSKYYATFEFLPFFRFIEDLNLFLDEHQNSDYAKARLSCIDQFYDFKIEKEGNVILSGFDDWEKWKPARVRREDYETEIKRVCRQFLKDYTARLEAVLEYS